MIKEYFYGGLNQWGLGRVKESGNGWEVFAFDKEDDRDDFVSKYQNADYLTKEDVIRILDNREPLPQDSEGGRLGKGYLVIPGYPMTKAYRK